MDIRILLILLAATLVGCSNDTETTEMPDDMKDYLIAEKLNYDSQIYPASCHGFAKDFYTYLIETLVPTLERKESHEITKLREDNKVHYRNLTPCASAEYRNHKPKELNFEFYGHVAVTLSMIDMYMKWYVDEPGYNCPCLMALEEAKRLQAYMRKYSTYLALNSALHPTKNRYAVFVG